MKQILLAALAILVAAEAGAAETLGRLFFTPEQRAQLDVARAQRSRATLAAEVQEAAPAPETVTYQGVVRRSDGRNTIWMNDRTLNEGQESGRLPPAQVRPDGTVVLELPQSERRVRLKVGQSVELLSGTIAEPYTRDLIPQKPVTGTTQSSKAPAKEPSEESRPSVPAGKPAAAPAPVSAPAPGESEKAAIEAELKAALERLQASGQGDHSDATRRP